MEVKDILDEILENAEEMNEWGWLPVVHDKPLETIRKDVAMLREMIQGVGLVYQPKEGEKP